LTLNQICLRYNWNSKKLIGGAKMKKSWLVRHPVLSGILFFAVFWAAGWILGKLVNPFFFLLIVLGLVLYIGSFRFAEKWTWICSQCNKKQDWKREKYCESCGAEMMLKRATVLVKYCPNRHRIKDDYNLVKMCPKCGEELPEEGVTEFK